MSSKLLCYTVKKMVASCNDGYIMGMPDCSQCSIPYRMRELCIILKHISVKYGIVA